MGTGIICAPAAVGSSAEAKKKRLPIRSNTLREVIENRLSGCLTIFKPLRPRYRAISNAGAAHNAAGLDLSRSTNRSAADKSEKDDKHQQPEHDVAHNHCPFPCGHCEQNHSDKQAKNVPSRRRAPPQASGFRHQATARKDRGIIPDPFFFEPLYL
jgi:hypothetical protein